MCGLTGFWQPDGVHPDEAAAQVRRMADALRHRGPDDAGEWVDAAAGLALGHRRLAIVDLSPAGHQPMVSSCGRWVLAFNGEVYNHLELRAQLQAQGAAPAWRGHSDTETLLAAVQAWGIREALQRSVGMWALALWDRHTRTLTLARDRLGEKPLYYGWQRGVLLWGSELKALKAHPAFSGEIDRGALALYFRHGYVPAPFSIYRGIAKLPAGCLLTLGWDAVRQQLPPEPQAYWSLRAVVEAGQREPWTGSEADAVQALEAALQRAVAGQRVADVPLGAFLSGGIDSSTVVALMQAQSPRPVKTFTIGFHEGEYDEAQHAQAVARHLGTEHTELYVTPQQALDVVPRLPVLYDEPFADSSQIPTFLVAQLARQHVTVSLSGDGGDELLGGYTRYLWTTALWQRLGPLPPALRRGLGAALTTVPVAGWNRVLRPLQALGPRRWRVANPGDKLHKLARVLRAEGPQAIYRDLCSHWWWPQVLLPGVTEPPTWLTQPSLWPQLHDVRAWMMVADAMTYLPDDIMVKVDRAAMGVSLETRAPLLDHRVVELAWRLPMQFKIRDGQGKWLLRQVLYRHVPRALVERPKMGFGVPIDHWLRGPLRDWAEELLSEARLRDPGLLDPAPVRKLWAEHQSGRRNWHFLLWDVLMWQAWHSQGKGYC